MSHHISAMLDTLPATKQQAREQGSKFYFTGVPCCRGHLTERRTTTGACLDCGRLSNRRFYEDHREQENARSRAAYADDREARSKRAAQWAKDNPERVRRNQAAARARNPELVREKSRQFRRDHPEVANAVVMRWLKANPSWVREQRARRRASKLNATPGWLTQDHREEMRELYRRAREITESTGVEHHVDHIEPLLGRTSCGLHVPWNLQILTWEENLRKGNKLIIDTDPLTST